MTTTTKDSTQQPRPGWVDLPTPGRKLDWTVEHLSDDDIITQFEAALDLDQDPEWIEALKDEGIKRDLDRFDDERDYASANRDRG